MQFTHSMGLIFKQHKLITIEERCHDLMNYSRLYKKIVNIKDENKDSF